MAAQLAPETAQALLSTVQSLWPAASGVEFATRSFRARTGTTLVAVPNARAPRLLVPYENRRAASTAMHRYSAALSVRETMTRFAAGAGLRVGVARLLPDQVVVGGAPEASDGSLLEHLSNVLCTQVTLSLGIGSPRVNRKPVLQVFDTSGRSLAFVKVALSPDSARDVRAEAENLEALAGAGWREIEMPRLIHSGTWNGAYILVMTALATTPFQRRRSLVPVAAMSELASTASEPARALDETEWWNRILARGERVQEPELNAEFRAAAERSLELVDDTTWPLGSWHGDWTPWNMSWSRGRVRLWDWERYERGVPVGFDRLHFVVNARLRREGVSVPAIHAALNDCIESGDRDTKKLAALYLLTVVSRYALAIQRDQGDLIRGQTMTTLTALEEWIR